MTQATALAILQSGTNVFLTGEPGSGKTFIVNQYVKYLRQHRVPVAITASTGIAATHISGMTIHSWSGIGIRDHLRKRELDILTTTDRIVKQVRAPQVLIIDEISMLEANTLDMVDQVCRAIRTPNEPFGGLQVVLVGDFFQLPPISRPQEPAAQFAFAAAAWEEALLTVCYLTEQHRQSDEQLSTVLAAIRNGSVLPDTYALLETRRAAHHDQVVEATKLYSHNANVDQVNAEKLAQLPGETHVFAMQHHGPKAKVETLIRGCLSPESLELKIGAQVMCTRNNPEQGFANGTLGTVVGFHETDSWPKIQTRSGQTLTIQPMDWQIEDGEKVSARITQVPLRLAWAITVHKSQGMSLDAAVMDLSRAFAFGQGYVALSRVRSFAGLFLLGWNARSLLVDPMIQDQDRQMRALSAAAEGVYAKRTPNDWQHDHEAFLRHAGGVLQPAVTDHAPGEVLDIPPHAKRLQEIRSLYPQAYTPWTEAQEQELKNLYTKDIQVSEMAKRLQRHPGGIRSRLKKLGLIDAY